jgi:hypothetical protein
MFVRILYRVFRDVQARMTIVPLRIMARAFADVLSCFCGYHLWITLAISIAYRRFSLYNTSLTFYITLGRPVDKLGRILRFCKSRHPSINIPVFLGALLP